MENKKAFTLIELLVVVAIIGLLASIVAVSVGPVRKKIHDARRQSDIRQIGLAMEMCYEDTACAGLDKYPDGCDAALCANVLSTIGEYLDIVPCDPLDETCSTASTGDYVYKWTDGTDQYYCVYAKLEAVADTWFCASNKGTEQGNTAPTNLNCCGYDVTR